MAVKAFGLLMEKMRGCCISLEAKGSKCVCKYQAVKAFAIGLSTDEMLYMGLNVEPFCWLLELTMSNIVTGWKSCTM